MAQRLGKEKNYKIWISPKELVSKEYYKLNRERNKEELNTLVTACISWGARRVCHGTGGALHPPPPMSGVTGGGYVW